MQSSGERTYASLAGMRPGLIFVGLFALLMAVYFAAADTLGTLPAFALQAAIVVGLVITLNVYRRRRPRG